MSHLLSGLDLHAQIIVIGCHESLLGRLSPRSLSALAFAGSSCLVGPLEDAEFSKRFIIRQNTEIGCS